MYTIWRTQEEGRWEEYTGFICVFRHVAQPAQVLHIWIFFFYVLPPFFGFSVGECLANASLLFCFFPLFCGTREKVLRLLRSWIKHMNMTKSLVTSVSLQWVLASWSQTRHVLFMSQRILSDSLHFYWLLILKFQNRNGWLRRQDTRLELQILPACEDNDICLISEARSCDLRVWALAGGSDGVW